MTDAPAKPQMQVVIQLDQIFGQVMLHAAAAKIIPSEFLDYLESDTMSQISRLTITDLSPQAFENVGRMKTNLKVIQAFTRFRKTLDVLSKEGGH